LFQGNGKGEAHGAKHDLAIVRANVEIPHDTARRIA
jgi:hypothetical protein